MLLALPGASYAAALPPSACANPLCAFHPRHPASSKPWHVRLLLHLVCLQDIFDAGLVLGDTDYRQLSYRHRGGLPGIDIAYLLSGAAYHTDRDTLDAIRPGVLQVGPVLARPCWLCRDAGAVACMRAL